MGTPEKNNDTKIIAALVCLFIGFAFIWNIAAHTAAIYELRLDAKTCEQVRGMGLMPSAECVITAPFYPPVMGQPFGTLVLPDGSDMAVVPLMVNQTNRSMEWSMSMKMQFVVAVMFWVGTIVLLMGAFRDRE